MLDARPDPDSGNADGGDVARADGGRPDDIDGGTNGDASPDATIAPECVPSATADLPDDQLLDTDCDGIDGALALSVLVAPDGAAVPDGAAFVEKTLSAGIARAESAGLSQVLVAVAVYEEPVTLVAGVNVVSGYLADDGWRRDRSARATVRVSEGYALEARAIDRPTRVVGIRFEAADATEPGASSIAGAVFASAGIALHDCVLVAGRGAPGIDRAQPAQAAKGADGSRGGNSTLDPALSACGTSGTPPAGGAGGLAPILDCSLGGAGGTYDPHNGEDGTIGARSGLSGVDPANHCTDARNGGAAAPPDEPGGEGLGGSPVFTPAEAHGAGATSGTWSQHGYVAGAGEAGSAGLPGGGGGGGGSAGADFCYQSFCVYRGAGGGGGGAGGRGGVGGGGGGGGGASVALFVVGESVGLSHVELITAGGGDGGAGAQGGLGGIGGTGGGAGSGTLMTPCNNEWSRPAGRGGNGARGAQGGGGGGGAGGPSIGVMLVNGAVDESEAVTFTLAEGGAAGTGGGIRNGGVPGESLERLSTMAE